MGELIVLAVALPLAGAAAGLLARRHQTWQRAITLGVVATQLAPQAPQRDNYGRVLMGHPSLGSWVTYGLGSVSENLPAYCVMPQPEGVPEGGAPCWSAAFLRLRKFTTITSCFCP